MGTVTLKVADKLDREIARASRRQGISKSEFLRRAAQLYLEQQSGKSFVSAYDMAPHLAGSIKNAPPDLSTNPKYLEDYGK